MLTISTRAINVLNKNGIELFEGKAAWLQLSNDSFLSGWDKLYEDCPWGTVFQSRAFITTWYSNYQETYIPLFIVSFEGRRLTGLLLLAKTKDGLIIGAGDAQAEYQVWLATENNGNDFISKALKIVDSYLPNTKVQLKYIPDNAPMHWVNESTYFKARCLVKVYKQPLLKIKEDHFINELQKKNRREKLNRLKRIGNLQFVHITSYSEFEAILDKLALQFDFRKKAVFNTAVFLQDPKRKNFLLSLFKQGLLHTTVLKVNEDIIAANVSVFGKGWVHLQGVNTHAPSFAKYSPGILHLLMLGKQLASEGISVFDLTPGDDPYKGQLATNYKEAFHLIVSSPYQLQVSKLKLASAEGFKKLLLLIGYTPSKFKWYTWKLKDQYKHVFKKGLPFSIKYFVSRIITPNKENVYVFQHGQILPSFNGVTININSLSDMLCFDPKGSSLNSWAFFEDAMRRFEDGETCFSYCEKGQLQACVWLASAKSSKTANEPKLTGFYYHSILHNKKNLLLSVISTVVAMDQTHNVIYAHVRKGDKFICQTLKDLGFKRANSADSDN
ncbi:GNAT family N-acetyltransferase [Flavisolibacter tropicus]|uniref:BioF2-like acetyltransferase domain-containing protein n=1 Tax=Flavisolibacter tropicus TaxID=1492898 RepID=A0A172TR21_9BACT|nr:GNAT family N-acetyltransferase [Flavisolibacter tropicus]ANE49203.1 hypothetical protein SY85_00475 [Flavisolibacter tropicus]